MHDAADSPADNENPEKSNTAPENGGNEAALGAPENDLESSGSDAAAPAEGAEGADADAENGVADGNLSGTGSGHINQEVALDTIAQAESTRSFFLAQTLESTKTIPVVSAKLPLDKGAGEPSDPSQVTSTEDPDSDPSQHVISTEPSDSEASGEISPDGDVPAEDEASDDPVDPSFTLGSSEGDSAAVAAESTVIGSFEYRGITYAIEPGGESVAVVAADYAKLPTDFIEAQTIVLSSVVSPDGIDYYSVTRIADGTFASLTAAAAAAAEDGQDADASSDIQAQAEACAYGDQATSEPAEGDGVAPQVISGVVSLSDDPSQHVISSDTAEASDSQAIPTEGAEASNSHVISSEGDEVPEVEKSRPSDEGEGEALTDSTDEGTVGITAITIPASITTIEDDAFTGFGTLQYVIVSEDNPNYSMYDGCLYAADQSSLLLVPEGRLGAVRVAPNVTEVKPEAFSHCVSVDTIVADANSAASQLLEANDLYNANNEQIKFVAPDAMESSSTWETDQDAVMERISQLNEKDEGQRGEQASTLSDTDLTSSSKQHSLNQNDTADWRQPGKHHHVDYRGTNNVVMYGYVGMASPGRAGVYGGSYSVTPFDAKTGTHSGALRGNLYYVPSQQTLIDQNVPGVQAGNGYNGYGYSNDYNNGGILHVETDTKCLTTDFTDKWCYVGLNETVVLFKEYVVHWDAGDKGICDQHFSVGDGGLNTASTDIPMATSKEDGYIFVGWFDQPQENEDAYADGNYICGGMIGAKDGSGATGETPNVTKTVTYYAHYAPDEHDVVFDANGGAHPGSEVETPVIWAKFNGGMPREIKTTKEPNPENDPYRKPYDSETQDYETAANASGIQLVDAVATSREGYEFDGYWTTRYSEDPVHAEVIDGRTVTPRQYYDENMEPVGTWQETSPAAKTLYAHWKYKIALDSNVVNSDDEDALGDSAITYDMSGYAGGTDGVYSDDYGNTYTVTKSGDDEVVSIEAIYGAPVKLPTVKGRTGYEDTQAWGVTKKESGCATDLFSLVDGYTAKDGAAANIAEANGAFTLAPGADGINTATLYADWTGKAKTYNVKLVSQFAGEGFDSKANPQSQDMTVTYDAAMPASSITKPAYQDGSTPSNLVFLGFTSKKNGAYSASSGAALQGTQYVASTNDAERNPIAMADSSNNGAVDFRLTYDSTDAEVVDGRIQLYALWGYPQVDVEFDLQDENLNGELTPNTVSQKLNEDGTPQLPGVYFQNLTTNDPMPDVRALLNEHKTGRSGFEFNGFWTTKYAEGEGAKETIDGKEVAAAQYYAADGACLYDPDGDGAFTWDKTYGTKLYAHWKYKVYLDLNVFNSDGEAVLNASKSDFDVNVKWPDERPAAVEQRDFASAIAYQTDQVLVEDSDAAKAEYTLPRYGFTAIDGAPIQLPTLTDRRGYADTRGWGETPGSFGAASDIQSIDGNNVKAAFRLTPADLTAVADTTDTGFAGRAYVLHANWRAAKGADGAYVDTLSGHPNAYRVALHATYAGDSEADSFQVVDSALDTQTFNVEYDAPIDVTSANTALKPYATDPADETTINYEDATKDDNQAPRNLVLRGFYTAKGTAAASVGKPYVNVTGNAFSVDDASKQSGKIAFREVPATGDTVDLYAWWTYNSMTVTFDLQGGQIAGVSDPDTFKVEGVVSHGDVPNIAAELGATYAKKPTRAGYVFAGWWNTKYNEKTAEKIGGVTVNPKKYYDVTPTDEGNVSDATDDGVWREYTDTTLYAHWKYTISFDKQLDPVTDVADVSLDVVKEDNEVTHLSRTVALASGDARAEGSTRTDLYGNVYATTTTGDATKNGEVSDLTITAIAGAPVQLPQAQNRRMDVGNGTYEKAGYEARRDWLVDTKQSSELVAHASGEGEQYFFTQLDDSWTGGYGVAGSVPCKVGKSTAADSGAALKLYARWTAMPFYVELNYSYDVDGVHYASAHTDDRLKVTFDDNDYIYVDESGSAVLGREQAWPDLLPADSSKASATATVDGEDESYDNLDFTGVTTKPNAFKSNAGSGFVRQGDLYWQKNATPEANAKNAIERFRAVRGVTGAGKMPGECVDTNNSSNPFAMYVVWAQPTREITFDLSADDAAGDPLIANTKIERMKGDRVDTGGATDPTAALSALASEVKNLESRKNYVFGGFWTTPYQESLYTDGNGDKIQPVCYYVMDDAGKLVGAAPEASIEGGSESWLTSENASAVWLEDESVPLYAHWKYRITFANDHTIPNSTEKDMLQFGSDTVGAYGSAATSVPFAEVDAVGYADANGYVTLGAPLNLPVDQNSQGFNAIARIRDFGKAAGYDLTGRGPTGYAFAGWSLQAGTDGEKSLVDGLLVVANDEGAAGDLVKEEALVPQEKGLTTLYAQWEALPFTIELDYYPDNLYADAITDNSVNDAAGGKGTRSVTVLYDRSLKEATAAAGDDSVTSNGAITPPVLYGFKFLGYYATDGGRVGADGSVNGAGKKFYGEPVPEAAGTATDDGKSQPVSDAWFISDFSVVNGKGSATLHAYYQQVGFTMTFSTWDELDGTLQEPSTTRVGGKDRFEQTWHYGDRLRVVEGDPYQASGTTDRSGIAPDGAFPVASADTFTRRGYDFTGWYFYPDENEPEYRGDSDEAKAARAALHTDPANRVYVMRCDATNLADVKGFPGIYTFVDGQWKQSDVTTWRTNELFDAEQNYTLYAGWEPKTYDVTFVARCPESTINDESKTFAYGQALEPTVDLTRVDLLGEPYTFIGWNTQPDATEGTKTGWLFDKSGYVQGGEDSTDNAAIRIMDPAIGGAFMPNDTPRGITYYGIWKEPTNKRVVLFCGPHGTLTKTGAPNVPLSYANEIGYSYRMGVTDISKGSIGDSYGVKVNEETGYRFLGWAELSPEQMGISSYGELPDASDIDAFATRLTAKADAGGLDVNSLNVSTTSYFPNSYNAFDNKRTKEYRNPFTGEIPGFRDIYLIAVYSLISDYSVTLDLGDAATYSDKKNNVELGARLGDSVFQRVENTERLQYSYGFDVTKDDFTLPEPVSGMHDFEGWELLGKDGSWTPVGKQVDVDVEAFGEEALGDERMAKRTYRAVWTPKRFTIRFTDVNGNIPVQADDAVYEGVAYGDAFKLPLPTTRETGYPFRYWRLACEGDHYIGQFSEGTEFSMRELLYAMRMKENYNGYYMGEVSMVDSTIVFDSVWGDAISVDVPIQALIKVDPETGDILTQSGLALQTRQRSDDVKVVSLRHDRLTSDGIHVEDGSGTYLFDGETGKVYLSVHTGFVAEDGQDGGLFCKQNVDTATGRVLSGAKEQHDPLLIDLAKDAIILESYPFSMSEGDGAYEPSGAPFDLYDANQSLTAKYGFRVFNQTDKGPLPVRFSLLFANGAKPSDFTNLTDLGHDSATAIPVAQLHYTVQKMN